MRLSGLILAVLLAVTTTVLPQKKVSYADAVALAFERNPDIIEFRSRLERANIGIADAGRYPNPSVNFSWESLGSSGRTIGEWVLGGSMPLNFIWERRHNIASKESVLKADKLVLEQLKRDLALEIKKAYANYHFNDRLLKTYDSTVAFFTEMERTAEWKLKAGDISQYELQRIRLETLKYKNEMKQLTQTRDGYLLELLLLTGSDHDKEAWITTLPPGTGPDPVEDALIEHALNNRADLKALDLLIESEKANLEYNDSKKYPGLNLAAGYKRQFDNFAGPVIQLNIEVPLFGKNLKEIDLAIEEIRNLGARRDAKRGEVITRVKFALTRYQLMLRSFRTDRVDAPEKMLETALLSYSKGELSLVEFLDGVKSFVDGIRINTGLEMQLYESLTVLENAAGIIDLTQN